MIQLDSEQKRVLKAVVGLYNLFNPPKKDE